MKVFLTSNDMRGVGTTETMSIPHSVLMDLVGSTEKAFKLQDPESKKIVWIPKSQCDVYSCYQLDDRDDGNLETFVQVGMNLGLPAKEILCGEVSWFIFKEKLCQIGDKQERDGSWDKLRLSGDDVLVETNKQFPGYGWD